jgi:hypothetical protein
MFGIGSHAPVNVPEPLLLSSGQGIFKQRRLQLREATPT